MSVTAWILLMLAGGLGAVTRFEVDSRVGAVVSARRARRRAVAPRSAGDSAPLERRSDAAPVPLGTVVVNVSACLLLGTLTGTSSSLAPTLVTVLGTGFLGGYSTFSTACVEAARLVLAGRLWAGLIHAAAMAGTSLLAAVCGLALGSALVPVLA